MVFLFYDFSFNVGLDLRLCQLMSVDSAAIQGSCKIGLSRFQEYRYQRTILLLLRGILDFVPYKSKIQKKIQCYFLGFIILDYVTVSYRPSAERWKILTIASECVSFAFFDISLSAFVNFFFSSNPIPRSCGFLLFLKKINMSLINR